MNNRHRFIKILICALLPFGMISCEDLVEQPEGFVDKSNFYETIEQGESALAASMNALWSEWGPGYSYGYWSFEHDDQFLGGDLNIGANYGSELWDQHYRAINNVNGVLGAIKAGSIQGVEQTELNRLEAQARFLRGFNYFALVRLFGALPLITEDTPNPVTQPVTERTPIADVYDLIVGDFTYAVEHLPPAWDGEPGKPTSGAAQAFLAKAYLTMATAPLNQTEYYADARDAAKELIDDERYSLVPNVHEVFAPENKFGPENIWNFVSTVDDVATWPQIWTPAIMDGWGDFSLDPTWAENWLTTRPDEPRQDAYLILEYEGVPYTEFDEQRPFVRKFVMPYITQEQYDLYQSTAAFPIIRYADVLLIYAEAANMAAGGPTPEAYNAINRVRRRANNVPLDQPNAEVDLPAGLSAAEFDAAVIEERDFELVMEYDRWFDIVRKRILDEVTAKYHPENMSNFSEDDYLYPVPEYDAEVLGSQNQGYASPGATE